VRKDKVVSTGNREIAILFTASFFSVGNQSAPPFDLLQSFVRGGPAHLITEGLPYPKRLDGKAILPYNKGLWEADS
jgi:hypothetical protein